MTANIPEDSLQALIDPWWIKTEDHRLQKGALVYTHVPFFDCTPLTLEPIGRTNPIDHKEAEIKIKQLRIGDVTRRSPLPVAALSLNKNEYWRAFKSKLRPCLVMTNAGFNIPQEITQNCSQSKFQDTVLIAPFYGSKKRNGKREGFPEAFVERVRQCEYPQFLWDFLPVLNGEESILRMDQLQPLGTHHQTFRHSGWQLSNEALDAITQHLNWRINGSFDPNSLFAAFKEEMYTTFQN